MQSTGDMAKPDGQRSNKIPTTSSSSSSNNNNNNDSKNQVKKNPWSGINRLVQQVQTSVNNKQEEIRLAKEAKQAGKIWNPETKEWYFYFIDQELEQAEQELNEKTQQESAHSTSSSTAAGNPSPEEDRPVKDREYYDLLEVSTNADEGTIRKAYFKVARKSHPDKNPNDPEAHAKFQKIGQAYQTLSNPQLRAAYDRDGLAENTAAASMEEVDPFVFFNVMFGSSLVEPYIGELWLASTSDSMMKQSSQFEGLEELPEEERQEAVDKHIEAMQEKSELQQTIRYCKCAQNLRKRIADFDEKDPQTFALSAKDEAIKIVKGAYGSLYLITMGFAMQVAAEEYLGFEKSLWGLQGHMARTKKTASGIGSGFKLLGAGIKAASAGSRAMEQAERLADEKQSEIDPDSAHAAMAETIDNSLPAFLELAWAINKRDIQSTLHHVCKKVFDDASVPKDVRLIRAKAVLILGKEFQTVGKAYRKSNKEHFHPEEIKARVAVATMTTMAKAQGQEVSEEDQEEMIRKAKAMGLDPTSAYANEDEVLNERDTTEPSMGEPVKGTPTGTPSSPKANGHPVLKEVQGDINTTPAADHDLD